jgi:hypothetical protein
MASAAHLEIDAKTFRRPSVDEYHRMVELGVLGADEHVELLEGVVVSMPPHGPLNAGTIQRLNKLLVRAAGDDWDVRCQLPLTLGDRNEPEPDLAVVRAGEGSLRREGPSSIRPWPPSKGGGPARKGKGPVWIERGPASIETGPISIRRGPISIEGGRVSKGGVPFSNGHGPMP